MSALARHNKRTPLVRPERDAGHESQHELENELEDELEDDPGDDPGGEAGNEEECDTASASHDELEHDLATDTSLNAVLETGNTVDESPESLLAKMASRNARLTQWFDVWHGAMKRWLSSRSAIQPADLDDVAQEVFLRLLRYSNDAVVEYPQSYLFRIATNVVNEWRERARNSLPHDDEWLAELQIEPEAEPESTVELDLVGQCVQRAVSRLPPRQREVLLLHIREDLTYKQIAVKLKLTPRIVRRDIARAYADLRCELSAPEMEYLALKKKRS